MPMEVENIEIVEPKKLDSDVIKDGDMIVDQALMDTGKDLYNRQSTLGINVPNQVMVIGVGGVGSWVALNFALIGVNNIILIDSDTVDVSNLNRTMFKTSDVGQYKTVAMKHLIIERRPHCNVLSFTRKFEDLPESVQKIAQSAVTIDCRDSIRPLNRVKSPIIGGYNGLSATIHLQPELKHIWGEEDSPYTITPSYVVVPSVIASMIVNHVCVENYKTKKESIMNIDFKTLVSNFEQNDQTKQTGAATATEAVAEPAKPKKRAARRKVA